MTSQEIRKQFLAFFESKQHQIVASAPMVIKNDPTLMFTNAGMNQFKEFFLGNGTPKSNRITDTQKCLRVSGKHNDLEEVGMDTYHHTMFEMLGNWSFGGYFKKEAIQWAWELLTEVYGIDKDILYVSVFEGAEDDGLGLDQEAYDLWSAIVPEDRIIMGNKKDNFWEMGDQGPCGPCSEIHVDIRSAEEKAQVSGRDLVNMDHPQVVEIWNLVFMQFNRKANGSLEKLPAQHVDTGMGFERLCMVLQDQKSNYDTDAFSPLIDKIQEVTGAKYDKTTTPEEDKISVAIRVIADHVRAVSFSIADGQLPSNNGAGYVIRRILRRAIRYGFTFLNTQEPFIHNLVATLCDQLGDAFPELKSQQNLITNVIREEEQSFLKTLDQGLLLLDEVIAKTEGKTVAGNKAFELYDTYGFPIDLTALILSEKGYQLDEAGFEAELQKQKERSRAAAQISAGDWQILDANAKETFIGYDNTTAKVKITRYRKVESKKDGELYQIVLDQTPFYPEGGGQVGDKGVLKSANEEIAVFNTKKENNLIIHFAKKLPSNLEGTFEAIINTDLQKQSASNHTATHLLHQALRHVLGTHVEQKGSLVQPKSLRFDFSHFAKVTAEEIEQIEAFVNARISENLPLEENRNNTYDNAIAEGAIALFGEKYGDSVRSIRFGSSMELCGGIHVSTTAAIWNFKIVNESAVAAGIRRIEAITSDAAKAFFAEQADTLVQVKAVLKNAKEPVKAITSLQEENASLKKQIEQLLKEKALNLKGELAANFEAVNGVQLLAQKVDLDAAGIKDLCFELGKDKQDTFILLGSEANGKALLSCYISKELVAAKDLNAGKVVRELGKHIQGGGGGQAFFATAGGKNPAGLEAALEAVKGLI